jgi:hypothetical protein
MAKKNRYPIVSAPMWPDAELPLPRVELRRFNLSESGWLTPEFGTLGFGYPPVELHLREMRDVDVADPSELRELCETVGTPVDPARPWVGVVSGGVFDKLKAGYAQRTADNIGNQLDLPVVEWSERGDDLPVDAIHVREVAVRVVFVRLMVEHVRRALAGQPTAPGWQSAGAFNDDFMTTHDEAAALARGERPLAEESPETVAWARFAGFLNDGLSEISPRLLTFGIESEPDTGDVHTSFAAACVQIFNDVRDRQPYRVCEDETCGRLFRRQLGRSEGKNRVRSSGVKFCTHRHAMNQARRERRRDARAAKGGD